MHPFPISRIREARQIFVPVMLPPVYIGLAYLCTALTILSVQLLSDSSLSCARAKVLSDLGLGRKRRKRSGLL